MKLIRKHVRHGLIRAKLAGARAATGDIIVFLDSHCEANHGWLEPIVQRISDERTAIVCPMIDSIADQTMAYHGDWSLSVGGKLQLFLVSPWRVMTNEPRKQTLYGFRLFLILSVPKPLLEVETIFITRLIDPLVTTIMHIIWVVSFILLGQFKLQKIINSSLQAFHGRSTSLGKVFRKTN